MRTKDNVNKNDQSYNKFNIISKNFIQIVTLKEKRNNVQQHKAKTVMRYKKKSILKTIINNSNTHNKSNNNNIITNYNKNNNNKRNLSLKASNTKCHLNGKMINDVSKSTISALGHNNNKQNDKTIKPIITAGTIHIMTTTNRTTTTGTNTGKNILTKCSDNCSEGGKQITHDNVVVGDFEKKYCRDNEQVRNVELTNINEVNIENLSVANEATFVDLILKEQQQQQSFAREELKGESLVTVKQPLVQHFNNRMRHKNITIIPFDDSYQRTVDLNASNARLQNSQCELLELRTLENHAQKDYADKISDCKIKFKSLAERKALLKKEFFKDLNTFTNAATNTVKSIPNHQALNKRTLKKQHNLKLKIPKDCGKLLEEQQAKVVVNLSLVALRKLDLQKKQQTELKSANNNFNKTQFPRVKELAKKFDLKSNMILPKISNNETKAKASKLEGMTERQSPLSDEGCNIGQSPYSSDDDNDSIRTTSTTIQREPAIKHKDKVARSASSDSALGLDVDEQAMDVAEQQQQQPPPQPHQQKRRMTLTVTDLPLRPALLPVAEPTLLPESPTLDTPLPYVGNILPQNQIPSKVLLEERVVEIPEDPRSGVSSRRESSQSCFSDLPPGEMQGVRFVRTPSVVVSDYSDDVTCGITLEEIEYFRAQRLRRRRSSLETSGTEKDALDNNSDVSASSSCSNLYYCGSTISALDGAECLVNGVRQQLERKTSDCSAYSASGDEDTSANFCIPEQPEDCQDITDMLANQHLTSKRSKKVGIAVNPLTLDTANNE